MKVIAVANGKGGVGKTTTTANLGAALAKEGKRVLLADLDPQVSLTDYFMIEVDDESITLKDVLTNNKFDPNSAIIPIAENLDILPSHEQIMAFEPTLKQMKDGHLALRNALARIKQSYDFCLVDTPPSLTFFVDLALNAADEVLIPIKPNDLDVKATERFLETIDLAKETNPKLTVGGLLYTMVKTSATKTHGQFVNVFAGHELESRVFKTQIRDTTKLGISSAAGKTIFDIAPSSNGAVDYRKLAKELTHVG